MLSISLIETLFLLDWLPERKTSLGCRHMLCMRACTSISINSLKAEIRLNIILKISSYITENILRLLYKDNRLLPCKPAVYCENRKRYVMQTRGQNVKFLMLKQAVHIPLRFIKS